MNDRTLYLAILILGILSVVGTCGIIYLAVHGKDVPPFLAGIVGTTSGAMIGIANNHNNLTKGPTNGRRRQGSD